MDNEKIKEDDDDLEIEVVDDTPEEDRGRKRREPGEKPKVDDDDDERAEYSENVQKRIKQLKYEFHEERRRAEEAERLREAAIEDASTVRKRIRVLEEQIEKGEGHLVSQAKERIDALLEGAKRNLREALDAGDSEKVADAQTEISRLSVEKARYEGYRPAKRSPEQNEAPRQPTQPQRTVSARAEEWAEENPWFNNDRRMTAVAYAIHHELITEKGVKPDTNEYYRLIDEEMRKVFPSRFESKETRMEDKGADVVAPPARNSGRKPRTVRLTASQVALASRLGISKEEYAAQLLKEQGNG